LHHGLLGRVFVAVLLGTVVGVGGSLLTTRIVTSLLYGIDAHDPVTFALMVATLAVVSGLAAFIPARRASRLEPADVLRES
jgi:ABC-type antimicrobial peptide transport system permease subunit